MVVTVIIILIVIFIVAYIFHRGKNIVTNSNPIDGLHDGGTMGFFLGDKYEFCLSRLKHLNLKIDSNDFENEIHQLIAGESLGAYVVWGTNEYNNIKNISFCFKNNKLDSISIHVVHSQNTIEEMYGILLSRLARVLHKEPNISTKEFSKWFSNKGAISLMIFRDSFNKSKEKELIIQVLKN